MEAERECAEYLASMLHGPTPATRTSGTPMSPSSPRMVTSRMNQAPQAPTTPIVAVPPQRPPPPRIRSRFALMSTVPRPRPRPRHLTAPRPLRSDRSAFTAMRPSFAATSSAPPPAEEDENYLPDLHNTLSTSPYSDSTIVRLVLVFFLCMTLFFSQ